MIEANREQHRASDAKSTTDASMTDPATSFSEINEHVELKMMMSTTMGARNMNPETNPLTTIGKSSILKGAV